MSMSEDNENKEVINKSSLQDDKFKKKVDEIRDDMFDDIKEIIFTKNKENKFIGRLPNGKFVLLNKSEDESSIQEGMPYICALRHFEKVAFAKIISSVFIPRIIFSRSKGIILVYKKKRSVVQEYLKNTKDLKDKIKELKFEKLMLIIQ